MNILLVNQYAYAPDHHGGTRHFLLARELRKSGHRVLIVSTSFFHKSQTETRLLPGESHRHETIDGVDFLWLRTPPYRGNGPGRVRNMVSYAWQVLRGKGLPAAFRPDIVYSSSPHLLAGLAGQQLAVRLGVPHVFEVRDLWPQTFVDVGGWSPRHPWMLLLDRIQRYLYAHADQVVSTLPLAAEYIVGRGGHADRITWITNGIDLAELPPPPPLRPEPRPFCVMHAGVHAVSTGLDLLLDAAGLLLARGLGDDIELVLLGDGPEKPRHEARARREGLRNVRFLDPVPKAEVLRNLHAADAFLLVRRPSPVHRCGISPHKLADYLAAGRPVLFAVDSPWNPIAATGAGLTAEPGNAGSLADAVVKLAATPVAARQAMAARGGEFLRRELDVAVLGRRLAQVFAAAREGQAGGRRGVR